MSERGRQLSPVERDFFARLFARLETGGSAPVLLRNYERFPEFMGHDLDVFIRRRDLGMALKAFQETLRESGGEVIHIHRRDYVQALWFRAAKDEAQAIHLDFYHGAFTWHSLPYLADDELVAAAVPHGKFKAPRPAHEALNLFLTSVLWGGFFKWRYRPRIHQLLQSPGATAEFATVLRREFGDDARPPLDFASEQEPERSRLRQYAATLRRSFKLCSLRQRPFATVARLVRYWCVELQTMISPPGVCLAFLGPDGSGKSTVIHAVRERIEYFFGEVEERHWRPQSLRDVGVMLGKREKSSGPVTDPHGRPAHSAAVSLLRFLYYWLDYWVGYPTRVWKFRAKNHLVLFDRYAQDMWCDPQRYRLGLPRGMMKVFCRLVPQPDLTFVLLADAEVIHARKGEVPLPDLRESLRHYAAASGQRGVLAIDCNRPVAVIADEIAAKVLEHLRKKLNPEFRQP